MNKNRKVFILIALLIIVLAIPIVVFFSRQNQDIRQRAAGGDAVTFKVSPDTLPVGTTAGSAFDVDLILQGQGNDIGAVDLKIKSSDVNKLEIVSFTPPTPPPFAEIIPGTVGDGGANVHYVGANTSTTPVVGGTGNEINLGKIRVKYKADGGSLSIDTASEVRRVIAGNSLLGITNVNVALATYTIATGTTSPTATPTLGATSCDVTWTLDPTSPISGNPLKVTIAKSQSNVGFNNISLYEVTPKNTPDSEFLTNYSKFKYIGTGSCTATTCSWSVPNMPDVDIYKPAVGDHQLVVVVNDSKIYGAGAGTPSVCITRLNFTATAADTGTPTPTTTPVPTGSVQLLFNNNIKLEGISNNGQVLGSPNPPMTTTKILSVQLYDANDDTLLIAAGAGNIVYNNGRTPASTFKNFGTAPNNNIIVSPVGSNTITAGATYRVKVKTDRYLKKWAGIITIPATIGTTPISVSPNNPIILLGGDITNTNLVDLIGYNTLIDCGAATYNPLPQVNSIANALKIAACKQHANGGLNITMVDLNDDGFIDSIDYQILTGNLLKHYGD